MAIMLRIRNRLEQRTEDRLKVPQHLDISHPLLIFNRLAFHTIQTATQAHLQRMVLYPIVSLDGHFLTACLYLRRSCKPANGFTICLADYDVGLVVSAELWLT